MAQRLLFLSGGQAALMYPESEEITDEPTGRRGRRRHGGGARRDWEILGWANVNQKGHFNRAHHHVGPCSQWSGMNYVQVGDLRPNASVTGRTVFEDRTMPPKEIISNPDPFERQVTMMPKNGLMVIFPMERRS